MNTTTLRATARNKWQTVGEMDEKHCIIRQNRSDGRRIYSIGASDGGREVLQDSRHKLKVMSTEIRNECTKV